MGASGIGRVPTPPERPSCQVEPAEVLQCGFPGRPWAREATIWAGSDPHSFLKRRNPVDRQRSRAT